jgi:nicotinate dehydrogenase subunit A
MSSITLRVNGASHRVSVEPSTPLLYVLRNDLGLEGPKYGCGLGQCGACTVMLDGKAVRSCQTRIDRVAGHAVTTIEGLGTAAAPDRVQTAFIAEQAAQCGYCTNGMIMTAAAFLAQTAKPTDDQVKQSLAGNLCRCGTYTRIVRAVMGASRA